MKTLYENLQTFMKGRLTILLLCFLVMQLSYAQKREMQADLKVKRFILDDKPDSVIFEAYTTDAGWKFDMIYRFYYDDEGFNTQWIYSNYEYSGWVNSMREVHIKTAAGKMAEYISYVWNKDSIDWIPQKKVIYSYDDDHFLTGDSVYQWNTDHSEWVISDKGIYINDENGNVLADTFCIWKSADEKWINDYRDEYSYDENGNLKETKGYSWIKENSAWNPENRNVFDRDEQGNDTLRTGYDWNEIALEWTIDNKTEHSFNENGKSAISYYYIWDNSGEKWEYYYKSEYTYDEKGRAYQYQYDNWNAGLNQFVPNQKQTHFYSESSTSVSETRNNEIILYPNPSYRFLYIRTDNPIPDQIQLTIYNLQGKTVLSQACTGSEIVGISGLPAGTYIYKIKYGSNCKTGKLLIEK